jgi:hypothetical protein
MMNVYLVKQDGNNIEFEDYYDLYRNDIYDQNFLKNYEIKKQVIFVSKNRIILIKVIYIIIFSCANLKILLTQSKVTPSPIY